ncbi:MAG TPA: 7TM diverse intracellular signaling domain-containing protein [Niabella sp.]|nr:7TM diverse intracellular signaling domain-containing protein [Niabella sp.]
MNRTIVYAINDPESMSIDSGVSIYYENGTQLSIEDAANARYTKLEKGIVNLGLQNNGFWLTFTVTNRFKEEKLYLKIAQPAIDRITLYYISSSDTNYVVKDLGEDKPFNERIIKSPNYIFPVNIAPGKTGKFFLRIKSSDPVQIPITLKTAKGIFQDENETALIFGIYLGIIVIMILYHLMIYTTVKDQSYLYYVLFIIGVGLSQITLRGYGFQYLWPRFPIMAHYSTIIVPFFSGITMAMFLKKFLQTKKLVPSWNIGINLFVGLYCLSCITGLFSSFTIGVLLLQVAAFSGSIFCLALGFVLVRKKYRPATFFMIAYSVFFVAIILFVLSNFNVIQYNRFTAFILEIGSAIQIVLLSLALADKINTYRREQFAARQEALSISLENERLIREQNIFLEAEVNKRTQQLVQANNDLTEALSTLKNTQAQLVNSEKMSSLGQLTAGIAHEINNPINFVTANIKPLQMDIEDLQSIILKYEQMDLTDNVPLQMEAVEEYKKQIDFDYLKKEIEILLAGISEGANRTADIVKELRNFARVDEDQMKFTDLENGIDSTLLILKHKLSADVQTIREKGGIPLVECIPGKMNQIFMNIIVNALDAMKINVSKRLHSRLHIKTWTENQEVHISFKDNGTGISEARLNQIFDPFFTTKEVGEGTGLGLSITQSIIKQHNGTIKVVTKEGEGSEFIIILPITQTKKIN